MTERLIIAGSGGQGIMLLGKVLAEAAMLEDKFVTWLPAYGAEVRGGTAHCMVIISDKHIASPYIDKADIAIIMNEPSLKRFKDRIQKNGLLLLNSSLAACGPKTKGVVKHPFTDIAIGLGNIRVANIVALGCLLGKRKIVSLKTVDQVMVKMAPADKHNLIAINKKALEEGVLLK